MAISKITENGLTITDLTVADDLTVSDDLLLASDGAILKFGTDADVTLTHVHNTGLTLNTGLTVTGTSTLNDDVTFTGDNYNVTWDKSANDLSFDDNAKLTFGAGNDLQIYHTPGTGTFIDEADDGALFIRSSRVTIHKYTGETMINAAADGAVSLYYDDVKKLETASTGVAISGTVLSDRGTASAPGYSFSDDTDTGMFNISNADLAFSVGGTERMRINSDGRVGIGDTGQSNTMTTITENSDTDITGLKVTTGATSYDGITIWSVQGDTSSTLASGILYGGYSNSAHKFFVRGDGDIETAGSQSLSGISDINFKENIVDANSQWDDIKALKVRNYSWKEDKLDKADKIGLIAQEAELVSPNLVFTRDKINDVQYIKDENGKDIDNPEFGKKVEGETYKTLKYSVLYTKALKALQEAMTRIETLEAEVAKLKE